jgi:hypothetical protein
MRRLRRCLLVFSGGAVLALSAVAGPALASTTTPGTAASAPSAAPTITLATPANIPAHPTGPATMKVLINNVYNECFTPGIIYVVNANGIHVRQLPNGAVEASIGKGRWFDSEVFINGNGPYHCLTSAAVGGQYWVLGAANYDSSIYGYVGFNYLNFVQYVN